MIESAIPIERPDARRVHWSAIIAGALTVLAVQFALAILGLGIGASVVQPGSGTDGSTVGIGAAAYSLVTALIALFAGGWVAGRLSGDPRRLDAALHGFLTWALASLVLAMLVSTVVGGVVGGALRVVAKGAQTAAPAVEKAVGGAMSGSSAGGSAESTDQAWSALKNQVAQTLRATGKPALQPDAMRDRGQQAADQANTAASNPQQSDEGLMDTLRNVVSQGRDAANQADREAAVNALAARGNMSHDQAEQTIDRWSATYQQSKDQVKQQATEAARTAGTAVATAAWWSFAALVIGAAVAMIGGSLGLRLNAGVAMHNRA